MAAISYLKGLTTTWSPPSSCSDHWTYESAKFNSISHGLLIQNALAELPDTDCFPAGFNDSGRAPSNTVIYSPGACPGGYATGAQYNGGATTTAVCCPSSFSFYQTYSLIENGILSTTFEGCISTYNSDAPATTVAARAEGDSLTTTAVSGMITMWAQPITIAYRSADLTLFSTSSSISPTALPASAPASIASQTASPTSSTSAAVSNGSPVISAGAIAGIAIGATAVLALVIGAAILFRRRRTGSDLRYSHTPWGHGTPQETSPYAADVREYRQDTKGVQSSELDGQSRISELPTQKAGPSELAS